MGSKIFPQVLLDAGLEVERHAAHYPSADVQPEDSDVHWIEFATAAKWIILSKDGRIADPRSREFSAVLNQPTRIVLLGPGTVSARVLGHSFVSTLHKIERLLRNSTQPCIFKFLANNPRDNGKPLAPGRVTKVYPR